MNPAPWPHQIDAVKQAVPVLRQTGGFYLNHAVGTGKTRTALGIGKYLQPKRVLVLAPVAALGVWAAEIDKWQPLWTRQVARGTIALPQGDRDYPHVVITNYDQLDAVGRLDVLRSWKPELVVLDEAHYVKSPTAKRTRNVQKLCRKARWALLLSGTPAHSPLDWWSQMRLVAPTDSMWAGKFSEYKSRVAVLGGPNLAWVKGFKPAAVKQVVRDHIGPYAHIVAGNVLKLPDPIETVIPVTLHPGILSLYQRMEHDMVMTWGGQDIAADNVLTKLLRLQQLCGGFIPTQPESRHVGIVDAKLAVCMELIDQRPDKKIIVAFRFRAEMDVVSWELEKRKRHNDLIHGDVDPATRTGIARMFQSTRAPIVLLLQYRAAGVALDLAEASTLILYSLDQSCIVLEQMMGRVWRAGQQKHVEILPLVCDDTLESGLYAGLKQKLAYVDLARMLAGDMRKRVPNVRS